MMKIEKNLMREEMRHHRKRYHQSIIQDDLDNALIEHIKQLDIPKDKIISGYMAKRSEINITGLLISLYAQGYMVCLPVVATKNQALIFRQWIPDTILILDAEDVLAPGPDFPAVDPDILLVPLLAFDHKGHRLGQGMGYYDKTLKHLGAQKPITTIGVAYEIQQVSRVPHHSKDINMDMVITDKTIYRF